MADTPSLSTVQELRGPHLASVAFNELALRDGLRHLHRTSFPADALTLERMTVFGEVELAERFTSGAAVLARPEPGMLVYLYASRGHGEVAVAGTEREAVDRVTADIAAALRDPAPDGDQVPITFWAHSPGLPLNPRRFVVAPSWEEIRASYGEGARSALDGLMAATGPGSGGLVLWHGEPGTGKSYALRALAREWRDWCETHFITDADAFLGGQTDYLLNALARSEHRDAERYRLIVLEDSGELLAADARAVAGQALSRLLNLTDGLLGAGLRALVLVTTNEPLRRLHPAVVRPGRTWAEVEFAALTATEGNSWLERHGSDARVESAATLADLYALAAGRTVAAKSRLGFAA